MDRRLDVGIQADWGMMNLTRVAGWLGQELTDRSAPGTRVAIWNGRGFVDNVRALGRSEVDVAVVTPSAFVTMALDGRGPYRGEALPQLRAIGSVPQRDRMVIAVRRSVGVTTMAELRRTRPALALTTSPDDGISHVGMAVAEILTRSGVDIEGWGGSYVPHERPFECLADALAGRADAIAFEAVMLPGWQELAIQEDPMVFLPIEQEVLDGLWRDFSWPSVTMPAGYFPGVGELRTLDFSDFMVTVREDMDDDVAHLLAWVMGETRGLLEGQYRHLTPEASPVTYPLDPVAMGTTPIPLHPGAARYYSSLQMN